MVVRDILQTIAIEQRLHSNDGHGQQLKCQMVPDALMPLKVARSGDLANYSLLNTIMVLIVQRSYPLFTLQRQIQQEPTVIFKRGRSKTFRQNIRKLLLRNYTLNIDLLGMKELSDEIETHVNVLAPSRAKRVLSQSYGPLIILKNPNA